MNNNRIPFPRKQKEKEVREVFYKLFNIDGFGVDQSVKEIIKMLRSEHEAKEHFRINYVNMIIASDTSDIV